MGSKFCGVRDIPPVRAALAAGLSSAVLTLPLQGIHFVHHTCGGHDSGSGEFLDVAGGEVFVRKWDDALETFAHEGGGLSGAECAAVQALSASNGSPAHPAAEETERVVSAVRRGDYNAGLGPYPRDEVNVQWLRLTAHITPHTLARAGIAPGTRVAPGEAEEPAAPGNAQLVPFIPGLARAPHFSPVAARKLPGMTAAEVRLLGGCGQPRRVD